MNANREKTFVPITDPVEVYLSDGRVTMVSFALVLPLFLMCDLPFRIFWNESILSSLNKISIELFLILIPAGIILHEGLHGLTWAIFAKNHLHSLHFGFQWRFLMPFCSCSDVLAIRHFRLGILMPFLMLSLFPLIYSLVAGNPLVAFLSFFFAAASGSDLQVLWKLAKESKTAWVLDHPSKAGFLLYRP